MELLVAASGGRIERELDEGVLLMRLRLPIQR